MPCQCLHRHAIVVFTPGSFTLCSKNSLTKNSHPALASSCLVGVLLAFKVLCSHPLPDRELMEQGKLALAAPFIFMFVSCLAAYLILKPLLPLVLRYLASSAGDRSPH